MAIRLFSNGLTAWKDGFQEVLLKQLERLGIASDRLPLLDSDPDPLPSRCVTLYFADGSIVHQEQDLASLKRYLDAEIPVIPVLDSVEDAPRKLPEILHPLNAFSLGSGNYRTLVDEVLARTWLARTTRKIFISYKRTDSSGVAHALRDLLSAKGFEVFLDDASIPPGKHFQDELEWWLNDADFILLLASPNFRDSKWVLREIQFATLSSIGLLALCWPGPGGADKDLVSRLDSDQIFLLEDGDLTGSDDASTLTNAAVSRLLERIAELRVQLIQSRLQELLEFLKKDLSQQGYSLKPLDRFGDFEIQKDNDDDRSFLRALPFRPTIDTIDELRRELEQLDDPPPRAFLYYYENDARDRRILAMEWLLAPTRQENPSSYRLMPYDSLSVGKRL